MWNHIDTPMIYSEAFESSQQHGYGGIRISSFSNKYRKKNPASVWISLYLLTYTRGPTPPAPPACPCPRPLQLFIPVVYFLSQAINLNAVFKQLSTASALPSFHISALQLKCWGMAWVPLFIQHCLQKKLRQPLPLVLSSLLSFR